MSVEVTTCNGYIDAGARIFNRTPHPFLNVPTAAQRRLARDHDEGVERHVVPHERDVPLPVPLPEAAMTSWS